VLSISSYPRWRIASISRAEGADDDGALLGCLERQQHAPGRGRGQRHHRAGANREAYVAGPVDLGDDDAVPALDDRQVAGLVHASGEIPHQRQRIGEHALRWSVAVRQLEQLQRQHIAVLWTQDREVTAIDEAGQHAEDLADRTAESARDLRLAQAVRATREQFEDVEPLLERRSAIAVACGILWRRLGGHDGVRWISFTSKRIISQVNRPPLLLL
jgi:hypothetical protein